MPRFLSNHLLSFISDDIFNGNYDDGIVVRITLINDE